MMYLINETYENTIIINKSKFITYAYRVNNTDEVDEILKDLHKKYYDSTHICYAYIIDDGNIQKANDDGEPAKTAGVPILDIIKKKDITNVLVCVIRYFGGILLGANGLVKAYSSSALEVLNKASLYKKVNVLSFKLTLNYKEYEKLKKINEITIKDQTFFNDVYVISEINKELEPELDSILIRNGIDAKASDLKDIISEVKL